MSSRFFEIWIPPYILLTKPGNILAPFKRLSWISCLPNHLSVRLGTMKCLW
jgi:hypothetical protein